MIAWNRVTELIDAMETMLRFLPDAVRVLLGELPPPGADVLNRMLEEATGGAEDLGTRVSGGENVSHAQRVTERVDHFERIIQDAGGWEHLVSEVRSYREICPREWAVFVDHLRYIRPGGTFRLGDGRLGRIARRHGVCEATITKIRHLVVEEIALAAIAAPPSGGLVLVSPKIPLNAN